MLNVSHNLIPNEVIYEILELCDFNTLLKSSLISMSLYEISRETINKDYIVYVRNIILFNCYIQNKIDLTLSGFNITDNVLSYL